MTPKIAVDQEAIDELLNKCIEASDSGKSKFPGMKYEEGVQAAVEWLTGQREDSPLED